MKNFIAILLISAFGMMLFVSCSEGDNVIDAVFDHETGAVLRTLEVGNAVLNSSEPDTSEFSVTVEEQDEQDGDLLQSVDVLVSIRDLTPSNGTTVVNDVLVKNIPASSFTAGPHGLPRTTIKMTFAEAVNAMQLSSNDYFPGDLFVVELRLKLTDGRVFGASSAGGIITGGFFSSPFKYNTLLVCSPLPGTYRVEMHDTFGDGWQTDDGNGGSGIKVNIDGTIVEVGMCSPYLASEYDCTPWPTDDPNYDPTQDYHDATAYVVIPAGTSVATWEFPGDYWDEISFEVYGPNNELLFEANTGQAPGLLPITLCL